MFRVKVAAESIIKSVYNNASKFPSLFYELRLYSSSHRNLSCLSDRSTSTIASAKTNKRKFDVNFYPLAECRPMCQHRSTSSDSSVKSDVTVDPEKQEYLSCSEKVKSQEMIEYQQPVAVTDQDVNEELLRYDYENFEEISTDSIDVDQIVSKNPLPISLERGKTGVFDVEELVILLEDENAKDIRVLPVPPEYHYVDYLVVATGRSTRHLRAMAEFIKWMYKRKRSTDDPQSIRVEGEQTKDWFAIDLGNIAVHLFLHDTRLHYDLETLWTVGYEDKADLLNSVGDVATLRQDFSFDAELERLRKLKGSQNRSASVTDGHSVGVFENKIH